MPNSRKMAFYEVVSREKMLFGMFLACFSGVGRKKHCLAFFENMSPFSFNFENIFSLFRLY